MYKGESVTTINTQHSPFKSPSISQLPGEVEEIDARAINTVLVNLFPTYAK